MANFQTLVSIAFIIGTARICPILSFTISSPKITNYGTWGYWEQCPPGTYATGFQLKVQRSQGVHKDDTALNGIRLICSTGSKITSKVGDWGDWRQEFQCNTKLTGFKLKSERALGSGDDDTGANNLAMYCKGFGWLYGDGESWGDYSGEQKCPSGYSICAIRTQVEDFQYSGDDTALNNVEMQCCMV